MKFFMTLLFVCNLGFAQELHHPRLGKNLDSGGPLSPEQAAYDVQFYRLDIAIDDISKSISGSTLVRALVTEPLDLFVLDLSSNYVIESITWQGLEQSGMPLTYTHLTGKIRIILPARMQPSERIELEIKYHGTPKLAPNAPWDDGFIWKTTPAGETWAGVTCEEEGGDVWWPCKDHPSDEADSLSLNFTVAANLVCVSNGRLVQTIDHGDQTKTYCWFVSNPINNYNVTFYLGPYQKIPIDYTSVTGEKIPAEYWFLPASIDSAKKYVAVLLKDLAFFEEVCGPFPFRNDKYALAEAPYWGMEHQSIIAYGNQFKFNSYGFDYIHLHELAHEWWGNLVTAKDWSDLWIHEGFATYMEALFVERYSGFSRYKSYMNRMRPTDLIRPIAANESITAAEAFKSDVYYGGAWVLHTLRYALGDSALFLNVLRRLAYPDPAMESMTDGRQCRLATVDEFRQIAEGISGKNLEWFFMVYLRQAGLPKLLVERNDNRVTLQWSINNNLPFPMPVEVLAGSTRIKVEMSNGLGTFDAPRGVAITFDPDDWIFMVKPPPLQVDVPMVKQPQRFDLAVYPNPFNGWMTIQLDLPQPLRIRAVLFSLSGKEIEILFEEKMPAGTVRKRIPFNHHSSGLYYLMVEGDEERVVRKLILLK